MKRKTWAAQVNLWRGHREACNQVAYRTAGRGFSDGCACSGSGCSLKNCCFRKAAVPGKIRPRRAPTTAVPDLQPWPTVDSPITSAALIQPIGVCPCKSKLEGEKLRQCLSTQGPQVLKGRRGKKMEKWVLSSEFAAKLVSHLSGSEHWIKRREAACWDVLADHEQKHPAFHEGNYSWAIQNILRTSEPQSQTWPMLARLFMRARWKQRRRGMKFESKILQAQFFFPMDNK